MWIKYVNVRNSKKKKKKKNKNKTKQYNSFGDFFLVEIQLMIYMNGFTIVRETLSTTFANYSILVNINL